MSQCVGIIQFKEILLTPAHKHELRTTEHISVLRKWKKFTRNPTYKGLREALDMYSVFRGRNNLAEGRPAYTNHS